MNWLSKLLGREKRRSKRHLAPPLMAFYWDGGVSGPHSVPDISRDGVFVSTGDQWFPNTMIRLTLQRNSEDPQKSEESITVQGRVIRAAEDGVGMAIMFARKGHSGSSTSAGCLATRKQLKEFIEHLVEDSKENSIANASNPPFSELGLMADARSPGDRTAGQEATRQDDATRPEPDFPGPASE